jgi:hypothetical protein
LFLLLVAAAPAAAQQTGRGDEPSPVPAAQAPAPAAEDEPPPRGIIARIKAYVTKQRDAREGVNEPEGVYPRIGGLTTGSGLTLGAGYRRHLLDRAFYGDLSGVISTKWYLGLDARLRLPSPSPRLELWTSGAFRRYTQEDYFGPGADSSLDNRANYAIHSLDVGGQAIVRVMPWLRVGADVGYFMPTIRSGTDPKWPSVEHQFTDVTAPGVFEQPDFLHYGLFAGADYRDAPGNPRRGGYYRITASQWDDRSFNAYDFRRVDAEFDQYVPVHGPRHVLVGRTGISFVNNAAGSRVPFYVLPYVGGANTVRSFAEFRFRDENALYVSGEYRFGLMKYVQLVGFVDAGKVAHDWQDINLHDMKPGYGGGVRAGTEARTFVRLDVGTGGGEGTHVFVKFFPTF